MVSPMTKAVLTQKAVGLVGAIATGIGLWRFTSGDWLSGIVFVAAVAAASSVVPGGPGSAGVDVCPTVAAAVAATSSAAGSAAGRLVSVVSGVLAVIRSFSGDAAEVGE